MPPRRPQDGGGEMDEQTPTARATRPRSSAQPKVLGIPRNVAIAGGAAFVAALVWFVWRKRKAATTASTTTSTSTGTGTLTGVPPYPVGLPNWLTSTSTATGTGSGGSSGGGTGTTTSTGTTTKTTTATATSTGGTAPTSTLPAPGNVHATKTTTTSLTVAWNAVSGATAYRIRVTYQGKLVKQQFTTGPATGATITGLTPDHTYGVHLASVSTNGIGQENDTDLKTSK